MLISRLPLTAQEQAVQETPGMDKSRAPHKCLPMKGSMTCRFFTLVSVMAA